MTKQELIDAINKACTKHYDAGVSKIVVTAVLDTLNDGIWFAIRKCFGLPALLSAEVKLWHGFHF